jgi:hypothetical protein
LLTPAPARAADTWQNVDRIVAIGDVHGDYAQFVTLLRQSGLVNEKEDWTGGSTHLVQTGDVPDRGPDTRKVMDLLMKIEGQAKKSKGYVHALIGNHEAMNVYGDLRYVDPGEYAAFRTPKSEEVRERAYEEHIRQIKETRPQEKWPDFEGDYRARWEKEYPLGYFEQRQAFSPAGKYGKWIIDHNVVVNINGVLFLHGGIGPKYAGSNIRDINKQAREEFRDFEKLKTGLVIDAEGPLWYRGLANGDEATEEPHLQAVLSNYGAKRIVIGHTPTAGTVIPRFGGRVVMIDVGLSAAYGRRLACLVIEGDEFYTLHRGERLPLPADSGAGLLAYLKKAAALDPQPSSLSSLITAVESKLQAAVSN